jgi:hypothetical protein
MLILHIGCSCTEIKKVIITYLMYRFRFLILLKGTVARDCLVLGFFHGSILNIWAPDFNAKRIFFYLSFSRSYSNISMNPRCRLLRGFKISAVGYCGDSELAL